MNSKMGVSTIGLVLVIAPFASVAEMTLWYEDDAVLLPSQVFDGLTDFTVELWVRPASGSPSGGDPTIISLVPKQANTERFDHRGAGRPVRARTVPAVVGDGIVASMVFACRG